MHAPEFYEGKADWDAIAAVKDATRLPLIANGDIGDDRIRQRSASLPAVPTAS